jgi:hypothetical protein
MGELGEWARPPKVPYKVKLIQCICCLAFAFIIDIYLLRIMDVLFNPPLSGLGLEESHMTFL